MCKKIEFLPDEPDVKVGFSGLRNSGRATTVCVDSNYVNMRITYFLENIDKRRCPFP